MTNEKDIKDQLTKMSFLIGNLRGILMTVKDYLSVEQLKNLKRCDEEIERIFYDHLKEDILALHKDNPDVYQQEKKYHGK